MNGNKINVLLETKQKRAMLIMLALLVTVSVSAKVSGTMPDWMWDSKVLLSQYVWNEMKSVRDLFTSPNDMTDVTITAKNDIALLKATMSKDGIVVFNMDIYIRFSGNGKPVSCYVTRLDFDSPTTFSHDSMQTSDPYSREGGEILGYLSQMLPIMFNMKKTKQP